MSNNVSYSLLLDVGHSAGHRRLGLRVVVAEWRFMVQRIVVADKLPADFVVIAAMLRPGKEPDDGVGADHPEKRRLLDRSEHLDLLLGRERRELTGFGKHQQRIHLKIQ